MVIFNYGDNMKDWIKKTWELKAVKYGVLAFLSIFLGFLIWFLLTLFLFKEEVYISGYLASDVNEISIYDEDLNLVQIQYRGKEVSVTDYFVDEVLYYKLDEEETLLIEPNDFVSDIAEVVKEKELYVRTDTVLYDNLTDRNILMPIKKASALEIIGYANINDEGMVQYYKVKIDEYSGYVRAKYLVGSLGEAELNYDEEGKYLFHLEENRVKWFSGGTPVELDYYPEDKPVFEDNVMPDPVYSWYLNGAAIANVTPYIELAQGTLINSFVVDIKDNQVPAYDSSVYEKWSPTNYAHALNSMADYKAEVQKLKDAGFYVIGRITLFKDEYYVEDHPENAILGTVTGEPYKHQGTYWPTAYNREVWQYNIELAREAVLEMGFNEIQFDYVRFPDLTQSLEAAGVLNFQNVYEEEKAEAIQNFLMYARDELHDLGVYVSADVFGESANGYVTAYGQYWPAISNVVDVISAMPYPDHFNMYEFGYSEPVWTIPYDLLKTWGSYALDRQAEIDSPAKLRTWIQNYNSTKEPYVVYGATKIEEQVNGLFEAGLTDGYITWLASSNYWKYADCIEAYKIEYKVLEEE